MNHFGLAQFVDGLSFEELELASALSSWRGRHAESADINFDSETASHRPLPDRCHHCQGRHVGRLPSLGYGPAARNRTQSHAPRANDEAQLTGALSPGGTPRVQTPARAYCPRL